MKPFTLSENLRDSFATRVRQTAIASRIVISELYVIQAH